MNKLFVLFLGLCILFSAAIVSAENSDFNVTLTPVKEKIYRNESAEFVVQIQNNRDFTTVFTFSALDTISSWAINAVPLTDYPSVELAGRETKNVTLKFRPISSLMMPGSKKITLKVASERTAVNVEVMILVLSEDIKFGKYYPRVLIEGMEVPAKISPRDSLKFSFMVRNMNSLDLEDVVLEMESRLVDKTEFHFAVKPYETKTLEVVPNINLYAAPGNDSIKIKIVANEEVVKEYKKDAEILTVNLPYESNMSAVNSFLKSWYYYTIHNPSNIVQAEPFKLSTTYFDRLFTWTKPKAKISHEGGHFIAWGPLPPGQTIDAVLVRSYRPIVYIAIVLIILLCIYYYFKPDLLISKEALRVVVKEGGFSESLVRLNIKNTSGSKLENVRIFETIPTIAEYVKEEKLGVTAPASIRQYDITGTRLEWVFDELGPREERVITYKMISKLKVLGKFKVKPTEASYMKKGKLKTCFSDSLTLIQG